MSPRKPNGPSEPGLVVLLGIDAYHHAVARGAPQVPPGKPEDNTEKTKHNKGEKK